MERYEWLPTVCAPKGYPVEVYKGGFYTDRDWINIPAGSTLDQGWGMTGPVMVIGPDLKPVPERLTITWLSFTENRFYTGDFELNIKKIKALFDEGGIDSYTKERETYTEAVVGLAPGGIVVVWLLGLGRAIDVGKYQAIQTEVEWKDFNPTGTQDRNAYIKNGIAYSNYLNMQQLSIPFGIWDDYRTRFNLKPIVRYDQHIKIKTDKIFMKFYNGEKDLLYDDRLDQIEYAQRARICAIDIDWSANSVQYEAQIEFDEDNIFSAYEAVWEEHPEQPVDLVVIINRGNDELYAYLQNKDRIVTLSLIKAKILLD